MTKSRISIALLSLTILATELFWTRLFSAEFFYTFAFLILSLAVLGLGIGALILKLFPRLHNPRLLPVWLSLTGVCIVAAIPAVFALELDFSLLVSDPLQSLKLGTAILILAIAYIFGGMSIAHLLRANATDIPRLYMADLLGAAIGVAVFIFVMNSFGGIGALFLCSLPVLAASFIMADRWMKALPTAFAIMIVGYVLFMGKLPEQSRQEPAPVIHTHWDATAKIKVYAYDSTARGINIDNIANSPVWAFDGNWNVPESSKVQFNIDVRNLMMQFDSCRFMSLGAGGGTDVLQALQYNASEIHAVEVNQHINDLMQTGMLRDFSGNIYNDPRVKVVTEDARTYVRRFENKFDVIFSLSSNTWAAVASGSFALAENYLFTTEAFKDYWRALSDSGYLSIEHQFYAPRLVSEVVDALDQLGVPEPRKHFAVYDFAPLRRKVILVSKRPLDEVLLNNAYANSAPNVARGIRRLYPPTPATTGNVYETILRDGWKTVGDTIRIDISPCTDNRPFIAQLGLMRNLDLKNIDRLPLHELTGFPLATSILFVILAVVLVLILPLNLLPYLSKQEKLSRSAWMYFAAIGLGYMMIEVILIQQFTLFIGSTIYSIACVLTTMLLSSGLGSRHSANWSTKAIFGSIVVWLLLDVFLFPRLFYAFGGWTLVPRLLLSMALLAPVAYFMGMPFPKAAGRIPNLVDWAFSVNGSASVVGSVAAILIATTWGYSLSLGAAAVVYVTAWAFFKMGLETTEIKSM